MSKNVKPLVWADSAIGDYLTSSVHTVFGRYEVWRLDYKSPFRWEGPDRNGFQNGRAPYEFETMEAAKAAAFDQYSERLRELVDDAFDPAPQTREGGAE